MKKHIWLYFSLALLACNSNVKENKNAPISGSENAGPGTESQIKAKDSVINSLFQSFNEIQDNLNQIKLRENVLNLNFKSVELKNSQKEQIQSDIAFIYDLLNKNRQALIKMNAQLKDSSFKIVQLQKFISNLITQISDKELEVKSMRNQITALRIELDTLHLRILDTQLASERKTGLLNRGYFAIGTLEELKKEKVLIDKGGMIGIGKVTELNPDLNTEFFSIMDKTEKKDISIAARHIKLIGPHPSDSYILEDKRQNIKRISITDPKKFWSTSNFVIVVVSNDKPIPPAFEGVSSESRYLP